MSSEKKHTSVFTDEFLVAIPKTDLHTHLDGGVRISTLIDLAAEAKVTLPATTTAELKKQVFKDSYQNLEEYLVCFGLVCSVLRKSSALERASYEFAMDSFNEGTRYLEVRFAPQLFADNELGESKLTVEKVLRAVSAGLSRAKTEVNANISEFEPHYEFGIIVCALRMFVPQMSPYYRSFLALHDGDDLQTIYGLAAKSLVLTAVRCRDEHKMPIVGVDIAGAEDGNPAKTYRDCFNYAHQNLMRATVHAGEGHGPSSIFQAITVCHATRIGHGYHLFSADKLQYGTTEERQAYVDKLVNYVGSKRIALEVCLTSNMQTMPELKNVRDHACRLMLKNKLAVSFSTDNRTVSNTNMIKELRLAIEAFDLTPKQLRDIVIGGFKRSFMAGSYMAKRAYLDKVIALYDQCERDHNIPSSA